MRRYGFIAQNVGLEGAAIEERVRNEQGNVGYNARTEVCEDLVAAGVVDPAKVTQSALQNAASSASLLLTTEALVGEIPEKAPRCPQAEPAAG